MLANLTAALTAHRLAVTTAQIYTHELSDGRKEAFDIFYVRRLSASSEQDPAIWRGRLLGDIEKLLRGESSAAALLASRSRPPVWARRRGPDVPTDIRVDNTVSSRFTVVDIFTRDRTGLLHTIARCFAELGLMIAISKVNTEGLRVADVFYVQDSLGEKLVDPARVVLLKSLIRDAVHELDRDGAASDVPEGFA